MALDACIVKACERSWEEEFIALIRNKNDCSGFVKSVAQKLGVSLPAVNADGIVDAISKSWSKLGTGADAANKAAAGHLVLAGLKAMDHSKKASQGHVVIVISGPLYRGTYPKCWGGSTGAAQSNGNKSVGEVWNTVDRDRAGYYMYRQPVCHA